MRIEETKHVRGFGVHVDKDELIVASGKRLPYATCVGVLAVKSETTARVFVWTPAASTPRGYKAAALALLFRAAADKGLTVVDGNGKTTRTAINAAAHAAVAAYRRNGA